MATLTLYQKLLLFEKNLCIKWKIKNYPDATILTNQVKFYQIKK